MQHTRRPGSPLAHASRTPHPVFAASGYCIFPLNISAGLCLLWSNSIWRSLVITGGCAWSSRASVVFMAQLVPEARRTLAVFPVFLFYILLSWVILVGTFAK